MANIKELDREHNGGKRSIRGIYAEMLERRTYLRNAKTEQTTAIASELSYFLIELERTKEING